jgi:hypothetical protein
VVVAGRDGLRIVSITDPTNPIVVGHIDANRSVKDVDVAGDYAYVADWDSGLRVVSIADPENPVEVAHIDTIGATSAVAVSGDYAYVGAEMLRVMLISDPTHPLAVGNCHITRSPAERMAASGYYVYAVGWLSRYLLVIRVADPTHPAQVWLRDGNYGGVAVEGSYLYVGASGVKAFSIADPGRPVEIGHYTIEGTAAAGVAAAGGYAYVACSSAGLQIFQYYGPGIEESHKPQAASSKLATILVRSLPPSAMAFDAMGRRALNPQSGIFFVREAQAQAQAICKVVVTR